MSMIFADILKKMRNDKELSQQQLAEKMYVTKPTISRWESGVRLPDAAMIARLAEVLGVDINVLINAAIQIDERPNVIMVDDNKVILTGGMPIIEEVIPNANVTGCTKPSEAVEYAKTNRISLAFLDIERGNICGLDVCRELLKIDPHTNVVYLTAYREYSFDAWDTGAIGFIIKPLTRDGIKKQLEKLRYPFTIGGEDV